MLHELTRALDEHEDGRMVFRHLARFERKFAKGGLRTLEAVPVEQLRRALADFESLVRNWSSPSLADLRSRMAVTLADRTSAASVWVAANSVSAAYRPVHESMAARLKRSTVRAFRASQQVDVDHVSISRFEAADRDWSARDAGAAAAGVATQS
jgi:hypothetical protein